MSGCAELLHNIQYSLHNCCNNKNYYNFNPKENKQINIHNCGEIQNFEKTLQSTKTKLRIKKSIIIPHSYYSIEYNVNEKMVTIDKA